MGSTQRLIVEFPISSVLQSVGLLTTGLKLAVAVMDKEQSYGDLYASASHTSMTKNEKYSVCQAHGGGLFIAHELN